MTPAAIAAGASSAPPSAGPGAFLGMTIGDAAKKLLQIRKQPLGNSEIYEGLKAGGLVLQGDTPLNTIGSVLSRRFKDEGDIVRIGRGTWGLAEWYPNRSFKKKAKDEGETEARDEDETSEPEQPSKPKLAVATG